MKKKMKKVIALLLSVVLLLGMTACKSTTESKTGDTSSSQAGTGNESTDNSPTGTDKKNTEVTHIVMTYLTIGVTPTDLQKVQDAVNAISIPEIGVEVEFKDIAFADSFSQYPLWISTGEQVDLMCVTDVTGYVSSGQVQGISKLLSANAPTITADDKEFPLTKNATIDGEIYGVSPIYNSYGQRGSYMIKKDIWDALGMELKDFYTLDDLTEVFAEIKKQHPDMYPFSIKGSDVSSTQSIFSSSLTTLDTLGATFASGVVMGTDSTKVVDLFETDEYYNYLKHAREWYKAGYIMPDAATVDSLPAELVASGKVAGITLGSAPGMAELAATQYGCEFVPLNVTDTFYHNPTPGTCAYWTVPITSANPEAAVKFLDLMYSNSDVTNLICRGIKGEHYVVTDEKNKIISFPDGVNPSNSTYFYPLGLYGDQRNYYTFGVKGYDESYDAFTQKAMSNSTKVVGYIYNNTKMTNQLTAISLILGQYLPTLDTGSGDLETLYPKFVQALKDAGIDDVIADNQAQLDAWLAKQ